MKTSRAAIKLEAKALIRRAPKRGDQRAHTLQLSRRGMVVYRQIVSLAHAIQAELVRGFDDAELRAFEAVVDKAQHPLLLALITELRLLGPDYLSDGSAGNPQLLADHHNRHP